MKKQLVKGLLVAALVTAVMPALAAYRSSLPSFGFEQEFAGVTANGHVSADLYTTYAPYEVRIGAFGGEVMIDPTNATNSTGVGYKGLINRNLAAYGKIFLYSPSGGTSQTNITLGVAYTGESNGFIYNGNANLFNTSGGGTSTSTVDLKGAGFYRMQTRSLPGKAYLGGELSLQLSPSPTSTSLFLGARWEPNPSVLIDLGLMSSVGTGGATTTTFGTPAFGRLTINL